MTKFTERRSTDSRRDENDRRIGGAEAFDGEQNNRGGGERRQKDRRIRCIYCGKTYKSRGTAARVCLCRMKALQNPGI